MTNSYRLPETDLSEPLDSYNGFPKPRFPYEDDTRIFVDVHFERLMPDVIDLIDDAIAIPGAAAHLLHELQAYDAVGRLQRAMAALRSAADDDGLADVGPAVAAFFECVSAIADTEEGRRFYD